MFVNPHLSRFSTYVMVMCFFVCLFMILSCKVKTLMSKIDKSVQMRCLFDKKFYENGTLKQ